MDKNKKILEKLKFGDVIRYKEYGTTTYLIIQKNENREILGQMASPLGVNGISIEKLLEKEDLEIANWNKTQ